jgi:hypothetical protein
MGLLQPTAKTIISIMAATAFKALSITFLF